MKIFITVYMSMARFANKSSSEKMTMMHEFKEGLSFDDAMVIIVPSYESKGDRIEVAQLVTDEAEFNSMVSKSRALSEDIMLFLKQQ
jgi:hypothetical protein